MSITTFNEIFLFPAKRIYARHDILQNSIGTLPMEIDCITTITLFVTLSYPLLIIGHIICTLLFHFLNGKFHPFGLILTNNKP